MGIYISLKRRYRQIEVHMKQCEQIYVLLLRGDCSSRATLENCDPWPIALADTHLSLRALKPTRATGTLTVLCSNQKHQHLAAFAALGYLNGEPAAYAVHRHMQFFLCFLLKT